MQNIIELAIIILISYLIIYLLEDNKEHYNTSVVGYNNIEVPAYSIPNIFDSETQELIGIFKEAFDDDDVEPLGFKEHNPYIPFPFNASIKELIIDYMKTNIKRFKGDKLEILNDLNKIYYKDYDNDRIFIFNVSLVNNTRFSSRDVRVKLRIKNIGDFIKGVKTEQNEIDYKTDISYQNIVNVLVILSIRLVKSEYIQFEFNGFDSLQPNYYQIKNALGLTEPFITTGKDMIITEEMKKDFIKDEMT